MKTEQKDEQKRKAGDQTVFCTNLQISNSKYGCNEFYSVSWVANMRHIAKCCLEAKVSTQAECFSNRQLPSTCSYLILKFHKYKQNK